VDSYTTSLYIVCLGLVVNNEFIGGWYKVRRVKVEERLIV